MCVIDSATDRRKQMYHLRTIYIRNCSISELEDRTNLPTQLINRVELTIIQTRRSGRRMADSHCTYLEGFTSVVDPNSLNKRASTDLAFTNRGWSMAGHSISSGITLRAGICSGDPLKHKSRPTYVYINDWTRQRSLIHGTNPTRCHHVRVGA